jgi:hypothetical protein
VFSLIVAVPAGFLIKTKSNNESQNGGKQDYTPANQSIQSNRNNMTVVRNNQINSTQGIYDENTQKPGESIGE